MTTPDGKSRISSQAIILTVTNLIISLIGLLSSMLLSRYRTLDEYGTYSQVIMITELVSTVFLMGLPQTVNYFLSKAESENERKRFFTLYSLLSTAITVIIGICLYISTPLIVSYFNNPYITTFSYLFAIYPWASIMINTLSSVMVVYGKSARLSIYTVIHTLITLTAVILTVSLSVEFEKYVLIYVITTAAYSVFAYIQCFIHIGGFTLSGNIRAMLREIMAFAIPMGLASGVGSLNIELDKLFIGTLFTTEEYALYTNAARSLPLTVLATALTSALMPKLVGLLKSQRNEKAVELWGHTIRISYIVMCVIVGGLIIFAPEAMSVLYSDKYVTEASVTVFRIYALTMLFKVTYFGIILNSKGRTDLIFVCALISLAANCVGNIAFYHLFGFIGPAISTLVVTVITATAQLIATAKITSVRLSAIFPYKSIIRYSVEVILLCVPFAILKYTALNEIRGSLSIIISFFLGAILCVGYCLIKRKALKESYILLNEFKEDYRNEEEKND